MDQSQPDRGSICQYHSWGNYASSVSCVECRRAIKAWLSDAVAGLPSFEAVAFTGSSGAAFGYWLADEMGVEPVHVLKSGEESHGGSQRGYAAGSWIFLDDFTSSGATFERVSRALGGQRCVGALLWLPQMSSPSLVGIPTIFRKKAEWGAQPYTSTIGFQESAPAEAILGEPCHPQLPKLEPQSLSESALLSPSSTPAIPPNSRPSPAMRSVQSFTSGLATLADRLAEAQVNEIIASADRAMSQLLGDLVLGPTAEAGLCTGLVGADCGPVPAGNEAGASDPSRV